MMTKTKSRNCAALLALFAAPLALTVLALAAPAVHEQFMHIHGFSKKNNAQNSNTLYVT